MVRTDTYCMKSYPRAQRIRLQTLAYEVSELEHEPNKLFVYERYDASKPCRRLELNS